MNYSQWGQCHISKLLGRIEGQVRVVIVVGQGVENCAEIPGAVLRGEENCAQLVESSSCREGREHPGDSRLLLKLSGESALQAGWNKPVLWCGRAPLLFILELVGLGDGGVQNLGEPVVVEKIAQHGVVGRIASVLQPVGERCQQKAVGLPRPELGALCCADLQPRRLELIVGVKVHLCVPGEVARKVDEFRSTVQQGAVANATLLAFGSPADQRLVNAEKFTGIGEDRGVIGEVDNALVGCHF